jgi:hypothetical protein
VLAEALQSLGAGSVMFRPMLRNSGGLAHHKRTWMCLEIDRCRLQVRSNLAPIAYATRTLVAQSMAEGLRS